MGDGVNRIAADEGTDKLDIKVLPPLCLAAFLGVLNAVAPQPFLPDIAGDLGTTVPLVGQLSTASLIVTAAGGLVIGPLADRYGQRRTMTVGLFAIVISALGTAIAPTYALILGARLFAGLGGAMTIGVSFAAVSSRFTGDAQRRALSIVAAAIASAIILGFPVLTTISTWTGWRGSFVFVAGVAVVTAVLLRWILPADAPVSGERLSIRNILTAYTPLFHDQSMLALFVAFAIRTVCFVGPMTYLGAFLIDEHGFTTQEVGLVYTIDGGAFLIGSLIAGGRLGRLNLRFIFSVVTVIMAFTWFALFLLELGALPTVALVAVASFTAALAEVSYLSIIAHETPAGAGTTMVLNESVFSVGGALGASLGGILIGLGGYSLLGTGLPFFALAAAVLVWRPARIVRRFMAS